MCRQRASHREAFLLNMFALPFFFSPLPFPTKLQRSPCNLCQPSTRKYPPLHGPYSLWLCLLYCFSTQETSNRKSGDTDFNTMARTWQVCEFFFFFFAVAEKPECTMERNTAKSTSFCVVKPKYYCKQPS